MKKLKQLALNMLVILPYLVSGLLLFFALIQKDSGIGKQVNDIQSTLRMSDAQLFLFMGIIVLIVNLLIFVVTFFIFKISIALFDRTKQAKDKDLFFALLMGYTFANLAALFINDIFHIALNTLGSIVPVVDLVVFTGFYYTFSKVKNVTFVVFAVKLGLIVLGMLIR